jgi:beta-N-acetylhexosaminidase
VKPGLAVAQQRIHVVLEADASPAVGEVPWASWAADRVTEGTAIPPVPAGTQLVLIGRDNHRRPWTRDVIDQARLAHPSVVVVDMGWPGDDRAYADVATFGASGHVGEALLDWLRHEAADLTPVRTSNSEGGTGQ